MGYNPAINGGSSLRRALKKGAEVQKVLQSLRECLLVCTYLALAVCILIFHRDWIWDSDLDDDED